MLGIVWHILLSVPSISSVSVGLMGLARVPTPRCVGGLINCSFYGRFYNVYYSCHIKCFEQVRSSKE